MTKIQFYECESKVESTDSDDKMTSPAKITSKYPKRPGTSGIRGQWYETKLLSLIYFRALHNKTIEEFYIGTNVDKLGSFDDICFKAKLREVEKPVVLFLQAKHRENSNSVFTLNKTELVEYFNSYLEIRLKFTPGNTDVLFNKSLDETDCIFVIYTTAKGDKKNITYEGSLADELNALLKTGDPGSQPLYDDKDKELLYKIYIEEQMVRLAKQMAKCIFGEFNDNQILMKDEVVRRYHVILGQKVFDISEVRPEGHRDASFRKDFFDINEEFLRLFKDELCTEILKRRSFDPTQSKSLLHALALLRQITDTQTLYKEVESDIIYKNGKFVFLNKIHPDYYKLFLDKINESQENIRKTVEMAVNKSLPSPTFKVPASFGNKDLTIRGKDMKIERKLNDLTFKLVKFIEKSKSVESKIVLIDDSLGEGFLELNGGIASAVGNLLILDESTQLMKINDNLESLDNLSKSLHHKLEEKIENLNEYKFEVKTRIFPKLSFEIDEYNKSVVSDFLKTLIFYTSQENEKEVEDTLMFEIANSQNDDVDHIEVTSEAIFLKYHDEIQKWSMKCEDGKGTYLDKKDSLYIDAVKAARQSLVSVINMMQKIKNKSYIFREEAVNTMKFDDLRSGTVIVTDNSELTVAKLIKHITNTVVLDFKYILKLSATYHKAIYKELENMKEEKEIITVFVNAQNIDTNTSRKLEYIAKSMKGKTVIIITDRNSVENAKKYFSPNGNVITDEIKFIDLSEESQKNILENTKVIFQGVEVSLEQILNKDTMAYVEGNVLNKIMYSNENYIGKPVSYEDYKPSLYIPRSVRPYLKKPTRPYLKKQTRRPLGKPAQVDRKQIETLEAFDDNVIVIFGDPGMGKSTLLTHLSLSTKENWSEMGWIVRINLVEHTTTFSEWNDKIIDTIEALKFLSQAALSEKSDKTKDINITLEQLEDGSVHLKGCDGNEWTVFELKMFLNFYNNRKLVILFDGFDEVCPNYMKEVIALIKAVKNSSRTHKMWITSRSYEKIYTILESLQFGKLFQIEPLDVFEQDFYLTRFWDEKKILKDLNDNQFKNICDCVMFVAKSRHVYYMISKKTVPIEFKKDMPFFLVGLSLIKYLKMNLETAPASVLKIIDTAFNECFSNSSEMFENEFVATPLHLNLMADYLFLKIKELNIEKTDQWEWDNIFNIYEYYLKSKLTMRFQEKSHNDMTKPDNIAAFKREFSESIEKHKVLAAYGTYYRSRSKLFDDGELKRIVDIVNELKVGEERTGIICNVVDNIPLFVHSTFEEYLAVEYICDLIKTKKNQKSLWDFILNVMFFSKINVLTTLDAKMKSDRDLNQIFIENKEIVFQLLMEQGKSKRSKHGVIESAISQAMRYNLRNLVHFFIFPTLNGNLNKNYLMDFIEIVKETNLLLLAIKMEYESVVAAVVNHVKRIDISKLNLLFENIELNCNIVELPIDDIIHELHRYIWMRMDIVPDFKNKIFSELRSQTNFI